jgi:hypothetical protein
MYFIHYIQTYASVNRKGSELQSHILKFKDCLLKVEKPLNFDPFGHARFAHLFVLYD